jgi:hypothetical protein
LSERRFQARFKAAGLEKRAIVRRAFFRARSVSLQRRVAPRRMPLLPVAVAIVALASILR